MVEQFRVPKPNLHVVTDADLALPLPPKEVEAFEWILGGWREFRMGTKRNKAETFTRDVTSVRSFIRHSRKAPWRWSESDFDKWNLYLVETREIKPSTQRTYQQAILHFLDYCVRSTSVSLMLRDRFGASIRQICNDENTIPHKKEDEAADHRPALTREQYEQWQETIDLEIHRAKKHGAKSYWPLRRDKALFSMQYVMALRIGETVSMDLFRWRGDPNKGEIFKRYAWTEVLGKGDKWRPVTVDNPDLPPCLEWYVDEIRPHFLRNAAPNEDAMWLSERGTRLTRSAAMARCDVTLEFIGLKHLGYASHDWRRTGLTHGADVTSLETQREKAGHRFVSTTAGYIRAPDGLANSEQQRVIRSMLQQHEQDDDEEGDEND